VLSRICEEFHCLPSRALWEMEHDPEQWATQIISLRSYARAKEAYDHAKSKADLPSSYWIEQVETIAFELAKQDYEARKAKADGEAADLHAQ
jgi:hypothetical protein